MTVIAPRPFYKWSGRNGRVLVIDELWSCLDVCLKSNMHVVLLLSTVFTVARFINASPFELTEQYVDEFSKGIQDLKKVAANYNFEEGKFDPGLYNETEALKDAKEYDFIIVGGGTSGAVLANRLSEIPEWKVLLLEAGAPETPITQVPALATTLLNTPYNWGYKTKPQESWCLGNIDHQCTIPTGRALGGSTAINSMLYTRGNALDYDKWSDLGNDGWCFNDVLPYFLKSENAYLHNFDRKFHQQGGPLHIENPQYHSDLAEKFLEASKELGLNLADYNGKEQLGFGIPQVTTKNGKRVSVSQAYLLPEITRKNLVVKPLSQVIKIIISPHTKEAYGVKYVHDGKLYISKASKEVILAAGAINTAQLLLLSGIGPKEELEKLDIHVAQNLNVGRDFKDHIAFVGVNYIINDTASEKADLKEDLVAYLKSGKGPLTSVNVEGLGFIRTPVSKYKPGYPDVELLFVPQAYNVGYEKLKHLNFKPETYDSVWKPIEGKRAFTIAVVQAQPKSRGTVTLKSKDPLNHPVISPNQLSDDEDYDISTLLAGIHKALEFGKTETFQKLGAHLNTHPVQGCEQNEFGTTDYWKCAVRFLSISLRHPSGTARMGPDTDPESVVDNKLRVRGIHKLRVADASVIPVSITGHINAPVVMIGEKAADLIKEEWK